MLTQDERRRLAQLEQQASSVQLSPAERSELNDLRRRSDGPQQTQQQQQGDPYQRQQQQQQQGDPGIASIVARDGNVPD